MTDVELNVAAGEVKVYVEYESGSEPLCPTCGAPCQGYDKRSREWRHLDTCLYKTILVAVIPREQCNE